MPSGFLGAMLQLALALVASGIMVKLLTLRQDRRKIAGEASSQEANAASVLTGASLQIVEATQRDALQARREATEAREEAARYRKESEAKDERHRQEVEALERNLNRARWRIYNLEVKEKVLEAALRRAQIPMLPSAEIAEEMHDDFPPPDDADRPDLDEQIDFNDDFEADG